MIKKEDILFNYRELPKNKNLILKSRELRKAGILSEVIFWNTFKNKKELGWDIDRQVIIGNYIIDFFIAEIGLIFEIDGYSHGIKENYDFERDKYLESLGLKIVHISDGDVKINIDDVKKIITFAIEERIKELKNK